MSAPVALEAHRVELSYGDARVLRGVELQIAAGEMHVLLGESGSGKTTLLRAIAGFEPISGGRLELFGRPVAGAGIEPVPPERRGVGVVFQDYALFPHLDVAANVAFGMRRRDPERIGELLGAVGLAGYERRAVAALSGGEQQRVALARALAQSPRLVLFDEPFSNLNRELRDRLRDQTAAILRERQLTGLFVTHDRGEAFALADRLSVMDAGVILETGHPRDLYRRPRTATVARALGDANLVPGEVAGERFRCALGELRLEAPSATATHLLVRPEAIELDPAGEAAERRGTVTRITYDGACDRVEVEVAGVTLRAAVRCGAFEPGQRCGVRLRERELAAVTA